MSGEVSLLPGQGHQGWGWGLQIGGRCHPCFLSFSLRQTPMCEVDLGGGKVKETSMAGRCRVSCYERYIQPCIVELLGSALFIFIGCLSVIQNSPDTGVLQPALAHGLALGLVIATLGNIR